MERIIQRLEQKLTCTICHELFRTPKTLPCLHTFCYQCLNDRKSADLPVSVNCPLCGVDIQVPNGYTLDSLPTSFYHTHLLELLSIKQCSAGSNMTCGKCKKLTDESSYCLDCANFFCDFCLNEHILASLHEYHRVIAVKQLRKQDYDALRQRQPFCQQQYHQREVLRYFCTQCETCICQACRNVEHDGHKAEHLQKAAEDQKQVIHSILQKSKKKIEACERTIEHVEQVSAELETNVNTARQELRETVGRLKLAIEQMEREAVTKLVSIQRDRQARLDDIKGLARKRMKALNESMEYANTMKNEGTFAEILQMKQPMQQRFQELLQDERNGNLTVKDSESFIKFYPDKDIKPPQLGQLQTKPKIDPSLSVLFLKSEPLSPQASKQVKMKVITKDQNGEICYLPETQIDIVVKPEGDVSEFNTLDQKNGNYDVTFRPQVSGKYSVEVRIENKHLQNSPRTLDVNARELVQVGSFELKTPQSGKQVKPTGVAVSGDGEIAVVDNGNGRILMYSKECEFLREFGYHGSGNGELKSPCGAAFTADGELVIGDQCNQRVQLFDSKTGEFLRCFGREGTGNGEFRYTIGVSVDSDGRIIVCDLYNHRVQVFDRTNRFLFKFGDTRDENLFKPRHCLFHSNRFFVTDSGSDCIKVFDNSGEYLYKFGKSGTEDGEFRVPRGLCVDSDNTLIVCNKDNPGKNCIQLFTLDGRLVGKSVQPIEGCWGAARFPDDTIVVTSFDNGRVDLLK